MKLGWIGTLCAYAIYGGALGAQTLNVTPDRVLVDQAAVIRATGLQPNEHVTIQGALTDGAGENWTSEAEFIADAQGTVDLSKDAPVKGSYKETSAMGLIWAMMPADKKVGTYEPPKHLGPQTITFHLMRHGQSVASADLEQLGIADGVQRIEIKGEIRGVLCLPGTSGRHPGLLVLGGSEGGLPLRRAAWLASRGFAALALAYFRYEDLPPKLSGIPLEYFGRAISWMMTRPDIEPDHIGVVGTSRGGELALQLGSMYSQIKAVVAYVPANVRHGACCGNTRFPYAWTWQGQPLPYVPFRYEHDPDVVRMATIHVETTRGPILTISGEDDGVWESWRMADAVMARLRQAHFPYEFENLRYPHAGHAGGRSDIAPAWHGKTRHPVSGELVHLGGTPQGNAYASIDSMPKVIQFLRQTLGSSTP